MFFTVWHQEKNDCCVKAENDGVPQLLHYNQYDRAPEEESVLSQQQHTDQSQTDREVTEFIVLHEEKWLVFLVLSLEPQFDQPSRQYMSETARTHKAEEGL